MSNLPKSTALLELEKGKLYGDQRDRKPFEPKSMKETKPRCPQRFSKQERKIWKDIAAILRNYGMFTAANGIQKQLLASAWSQYIDSCLLMNDKTKSMLFISDGTAHGFKENPILRTQQRLRQEINVYSTNLGLSSTALAKIGSAMYKAKKEKSEMEGLLD